MGVLWSRTNAVLIYIQDAAIQNMVRAQLHDCTVIAVAHRLRTIAFYDAVLVLDQGQLVEYDKPLTLLEKPDSVFRAMAMQTGEYEILLQIAKEATAVSRHPGDWSNGTAAVDAN